VWDQAGVGCIIAKYQSKLFGHETKVIKRKGFDGFGILSYYGGEEFRAFAGMQFLRTAEKIAENYDIIHIHDLYNLVPRIKKRYPEKGVFLHYHGTRLRETPQEKRTKYEQFAEKIFVSTPDLTEFVDSVYIPTPVDRELFSAREVEENRKALCIMTKAETPEIISELLKEHKISLRYETRSRDAKPVQYREMPELLKKYEMLMDLKVHNRSVMKAYSMTGLQALSLGLKVLNHDFKIVRGLPDIHLPENVVKTLEAQYNE